MPHYPYQLILEGEKSGYTLGDSKIITLSSATLEDAQLEAKELLWGDPDKWTACVWGRGSVTVDLDPDEELSPPPFLSRGRVEVLSAHIVLFAERIDLDSMKEEIASRSDTINKADKDKAERQLYLKLKEKWEDHEDEK
jgi:hypothetical protein